MLKRKKIAKKTKKKRIVSKKSKHRLVASDSKVTYDLENVTSRNVRLATYISLKEDATEGQHENRDEILKKYLRKITQNNDVAKNNNIVILYDDTEMVRSDINRIYRAIRDFKERKPILLILYSPGGYSNSAYLIGKLCREYSKGRFAIIVPRQAKSAATLLCCAADEVHMGSLSELGPIDPQFKGMPALGLKDAIGHIAELVNEYPSTAEMFSRYLNYSLPLIHLGYYERIAKSAMQYAERLLYTHKDSISQTPNIIANHLVYSYKDHAFVIDKNEAENIFGKKFIKTNTPEYNLASEIYDILSSLNNIADNQGYWFYLMGSIDDKPIFRKRSQ